MIAFLLGLAIAVGVTSLIAAIYFWVRLYWDEQNLRTFNEGDPGFRFGMVGFVVNCIYVLALAIFILYWLGKLVMTVLGW